MTKERREDIPFGRALEETWQLSVDRRSVCLSLTGEDIRVSVDYAAAELDQIIEHLTVLRAQMKPGLPPAKRH
jgi:hypothetical protein